MLRSCSWSGGNRHAQTAHLAAVCLENFNGDSLMFDLFTRRRQSAEEFHDGPGNCLAFRVLDERSAQSRVERAEFEASGNEVAARVLFDDLLLSRLRRRGYRRRSPRRDPPSSQVRISRRTRRRREPCGRLAASSHSADHRRPLFREPDGRAKQVSPGAWARSSGRPAATDASRSRS